MINVKLSMVLIYNVYIIFFLSKSKYMGVISRNAVNLDFTKSTSNTSTTASSITNNINVITRDTENNTPAITEPNDLPENDNDNGKLIQQIESLTRENTALHMILDINKNNPFIVNSFIVTSVDKLSDLIMVLTNADSVEIQTDDFIVGCLSKNNYMKVLHIYVHKGENVEEFKYYYGDANKLLNDEKISIKYVF